MQTTFNLGLVSADFDGDSNADFAVSNTSGFVNIRTNLGNGTFASITSFSPGVNTPDGYSLAAGQLTGSSLPELVVGSYGSGGVRIMNNNGGGNFSQGSFLNAGTNVEGVAVDDMNGDGFNDIVASRWNAASVIVFYMNGSGGLISSGVYSTGSNPNKVVIADVDANGRKDILVTAFGSNVVSVLTNLGGGVTPSFGTASYSSNGSFPTAIVAADFSGDGFPDIAVTNRDSASVTYLRNSGTGSYSFIQTVNVGSSPFGVTALDFDRDGRQDLAVASRFGGRIDILRNVGGTFVTDSTWSSSAPFEIVAADFNKDGRTDLVTSGIDSSNATVLLATTNAAPTAVSLGANTVAENQPTGTSVGVLSATDANTLDVQTFSLVAGTGSTDNTQFSIVGNTLRTATIFDFESKSSYSIRVRTSDPYGGQFEQQFTVTVSDVDETLNIGLSNSSLAENSGTNAVVGTLSATNPDPADTFTFSLPAGVGDNGQFNISGTSLRANASFDFETKNSYSITVRVTDALGLTFDKQFTVTITNVNETPTNISLSNSSLAENAGTNAVIGTLSAADPDSGDIFTFSLPAGVGDNGQFNISGTSLRANASFDFETKNSYSITARVTDALGLTFDKQFAIDVTDVNDTAPTISTTSFVSSGTLAANATSLTVTFSEPVSFSLGSQERPAASAVQIKNADPSASSGIYWIDPDGAGAITAFQVYCDMTTDGGGWMLAVNSVLGAEPSSNDIISNTGTVGLTTAHTRNLDSYFAGIATAEVRHEIDGSNASQGRFHGKYTADSYQSTFFGVTTLTGHTNSALLQGSFNAPFGNNPGGASWFYNGNPQTTIPASPSSGSPGPLYLQTGQILNSYRIWIRGGMSVAGNAIGGAEQTSNYELRRAGADGLLGNADDPVISVTSATISGNTATLNFAALPEDIYRLTVKDTITDASGNALDGDANGTAGANWRKDFVVGALSTSLTSPNGFVFDTEFGGFGAGQLVQGTGNAFDGLGRLQLNGIAFESNSASPVTNDDGRTVDTGAQSQPSVTVSREVTVPATGAHDFARTVDTFTNSTGSPITAPARIVGNFGSDAGTSIFATSDGDLLVEPTDLWFGTDDADGTGTPAIIHLLHGPSGLRPSSVNVIEDNVEWTYDLTVPAGATKRLANFTVLGTTRTQAIAAANALVTSTGFGGEAAAFLTSGELASLANFEFNTAPTNISLSNSSLNENAGANAVIGVLSATDANAGDTFTFSLPAGVGDNGLFNISGTSLRANGGFDFETKNSYSITARVTDAGGLTFDKQFTVTITNVNETPTNISLSNSSLAENSGANAVVGTLSAADPDSGDTFTFSLPAGVGDNGLFNISGTSLRANAGFDFETKNSYSITARVTDAGNLTFDKQITVSITDVNEAPSFRIVKPGTTRQGNEFRVNSTTSFGQTSPVVAMDAAGNSVVVWRSWLSDGSRENIFAQRYNAAGVAVGSEFLVNTFTEGDQNSPAVAMDSSGGFVVTWMSADQDGSGFGVFGQRFAADGSTLGAEFRVNQTTQSTQSDPSIAKHSSGSFIVTWSSFEQDGSSGGVFAQRFDMNGLPVGPEFRVNSFTSGYQGGARVQMASDGSFVVVWQSEGQDGSEWGIYAQRYDATGNPQGSEFRVNTFTTSYQINPALAVEPDGDFTIAWRSAGQDGSGDGVYAQRYLANGTAVNSEFRINTTTLNSQDEVSLGTDSLGNLVAAWSSWQQDGSDRGIYAQLYSTDGSPRGGEFRVNTFTNNSQRRAAVAVDADGDYLIVWESDDQDGSSEEVYGQRFTASKLSGEISSLAENTGTTSRIKLGDFAIVDDALGSESVTLIGSDASYFEVDGNSLYLKAGTSLNYEAKNLYQIVLNLDDTSVGNTPDDTFNFSLSISNVNEAPTNISLSNSSLAENSGTNAVIGTLSATDPDAGNTFTFNLPSGVGDNAAFNISGTSLRANASFDFETKNSYSVTVRVTDAGGLTFDKQFTVTITNVNETPTNISLSNSSVAENLASGASVGSFSTTDPDSGNTFTYSLVTGTGAGDNSSFTIDGSTLKTAATFNFEVRNSYSIRVRSTDQGGLLTEKVFTISVTNTTELGGIDVQLGQTQRSYLCYLDILFDRPDDLLDMISNNRFQLTKRDLNGVGGSSVGLTGSMFSRVGNSVRLDFGSNGLGGNRNTTAGDGYYELGVDMDGNGTYESTKKFYRLLGDVNGDRKVDSTDSSLVTSAFGTTDPNRDVNGDGTVNSNDRTLVLRSVGRKLKDDLFADD